MSDTVELPRAVKMTQQQVDNLKLHGLTVLEIDDVEYAVPSVALTLSPYKVRMPDGGTASYDGDWTRDK